MQLDTQKESCLTWTFSQPQTIHPPKGQNVFAMHGLTLTHAYEEFPCLSTQKLIS